MFGHEFRTIRLVLSLFCLTIVLMATASTENPEAKGNEIIERYKLMLERKPKEGSTFDRLYQLYLEGAGLEQLVADYQADTEAKPNNSNLQLILGHIFKRLGKHEEAIVVYQHAVGLAPNDFYPYFALGRAYSARRRHEDAISALTQAAELASISRTASLDELITLYKTLGRSYFSRDRVVEATLAWGKIAEIDPQNVFARVELADLFREQELYTEAIEQHEAIIQLKKEDPYRVCLSYRAIGKIQEENGDYQHAIRSYDAAIALTAPGNWLRKDLQRRIIAVFASEENWQGLVAYYLGKLQTAPNDSELIGLLASAYLENQQFDEGIAAYRKGVELSPEDTALRLEFISVLRSTEKYDEATAEYEILCEMRPDDLQIYRQLGELYLQLEDEKRAKSTYQRLIERDPGNAGIHLTLADIYASHEWTKDAISAYEKATSLAPNSLDYIQYLGEYYLRQDKRKKAVKIWNRMVAGDKAVPENYDRLARLFWIHDFHTDAVAASRNAVALAPAEYRYREALARRLMEDKKYAAALSEYAEASKLAPNEFFAEHMNDQIIEVFRRQGVLAEQIEKVEATPKTFDREKRLAKMHLKLGNITNAMESLSQAKAFKPDNVPVNRQLAALYAKQRRRKEAVAIYEHLAETDSGNAREYYADIARLQLNAKNYHAAIRSATQVIALSPRNPEGHQLVASIERQQENYGEAIRSLKQAVRLRADSVGLRAELAEVYELAGENQLAIEQYWRCWELSDDLNEKLSMVDEMTKAYENSGTSDALKEKLRGLNQAHPNDLAPAMSLAELYRKQGEFPGALSQLEKTLEHNPENPNLLSRLAGMNHEFGNSEEAIEYQRRLVKVQPDSAHEQRLAEFLVEAGREREAIQAWRRLLHARNQTVEADIQLAYLLIQYDLLDEARLALNGAGERVKSAKRRYQIGALLVQLNELKSAIQHFEEILTMSEPERAIEKNTGLIGHSTTPLFQITSSSGTNRLRRPKELVREIQSPSQSPTGRQWTPANFADAQSGALTQLFLIAKQLERLDEFVESIKTNSESKPNDLKALEKLAQVYILTNDNGNAVPAIDRLAALSPHDYTYKKMQLDYLSRKDLDFDTAKNYLDSLSPFTMGTQLSDACRLARTLHYQGKRDDAKRLISETGFSINDPFKTTTNMKVIYEVFRVLTELGETDTAEALLLHFASPPVKPRIKRAHRQQSWYPEAMYSYLADTYLRNGQIDKAVTLFWKFPERLDSKVRNVNTTSATSNWGQRLLNDLPAPSIYYDSTRLRLLRTLFLYYWGQDQLEPLYAMFQAKLEQAEGTKKICPALALSYFFWWEESPDKSREVLATVQARFPDNLTLMYHTALIAVLTGEHAEAMTLLDQLRNKDWQNRDQYDESMLQIAIRVGNAGEVRELVSRILASTKNAESLLQISEKLQQGGLTRYAAAAAKKATTLSRGKHSESFLRKLSQQLEELGKGHEVANLAKHLRHPTKPRTRSGRGSIQWNYRHPRKIAGWRTNPAREAHLRAVIEKNPTSFQAHIRLASYYEGMNDVDSAAKTLEAALTIKPKHHLTRRRYAQILMRGEKPDAAAAQYTILLKQNPNALANTHVAASWCGTCNNHYEVISPFFDADKVEEIVALTKEILGPPRRASFSRRFATEVAERCIESRLPREASEIYEKLVVDTTDSYTYNQLASAYSAAGEHEKAIRFLRSKLESPDSVNSRDTNSRIHMVRRLIKLYNALGTLNILRDEYEEQLAQKPKDTLQIYLVTLIRLSDGDIEGAERLVDQLIEDVSVTDLWWFEYLAELYRTAGDHEREARVLDRAIQKLRLHPSTLRSTHYLSQAYEKLAAACIKFGDTARAKEYIKKKKTLSLVESGVGSYFSITELYKQHKMWAEAEATYVKVLDRLSNGQYVRQQTEKYLIEITSRKGESKTDVASIDKLREIDFGMSRTLAMHYKDRGKTNEAIELFKQIAERMPEDLESRAQLAEVYTRQKKYDKAFAEWRGLLQADPENTKFQGGFVAAQEAAGNIEHAIQLLKNYIDSNGFTMHYPQLAELYVKTGRVDEAINAYEKAIEIGPGDGSLHRKLAQLYLRIEDFGAAEEAFHQVLRSNEDWSPFDSAENQLIQLYLRQDKLEEKLKQAEKDGTLTFRMQKKRAEHYRDQGELKKAAKAYRKALEMPTRSWRKSWISRDLVTIYARLGQTKSAVEQYERLYHASSQEGIPSMSQSMTASGSKVYFSRDAQAREETQELQISESAFSYFSFDSLDEAEDARHSIIKVYRDAGKLKTLLAYLQKRSKTNPENPALFEIIADIHHTRGDDAKAAMYYQQVCELLPTKVRSFYYAAAHLNSSNQPERAQAMLDKGEIARARCADGRWNRSMWGLAALGSICLEGGLYDTAIELLQAAMENQKKPSRGSEPILYHMAAQAYLELERYAEAIDAFQKMEGASKDDRVKKVAQEGMRKARREGNLPDQSVSEETQTAQ